ncbi:MAG: helix-turn-helix domain-containing protein [Oscillospiraceae bacterium]|nr:helix-turn-helix domain-containing protein [Oscillospiraceae bacterium]
MSAAFHEILSQLRKKKKVSQRKVAADLYISQALLSHYENGIREPGLDFVCRVCAYYGVTADYLLGRQATDVAEGLSATQESEMDAFALVHLLQAIDQLENEALYASTLQCFGAVSYRLLRHMASLDPARTPLPLTVPENRVAALSDSALCRSEMQFLDHLEQQEKPRTRTIPEQLEELLLSLDKQIAQQTQGGAL